MRFVVLTQYICALRNLFVDLFLVEEAWNEIDARRKWKDSTVCSAAARKGAGKNGWKEEKGGRNVGCTRCGMYCFYVKNDNIVRLSNIKNT